MTESLTKFSTHHPRIVFALVLAITIFFGYQLTGIKIDTDPENMLPGDEPVRIFNDQVKEDFGISDFIAVGVVRQDGAFTRDQLGRIHKITEEIAKIDGVVADDIMAPSLVDDIRQGGGNSIVIEPLMGRSPESDEEARRILERIRANPILRGKLASDDGKALALFIPIKSKDMSHRIAAEITAITDEYGGGDTYYIAGLPVAEDSFGREMFNQMIFAAPMAGLIIFLLMFLFFRNVRVIIPPMVVAVVSIVWTMGFLVLSGHTVHIMSSMIPIFLFPIAVLNSIHILSEFHDRYGKYKHKEATIRHTIGELFKPMLFTSATTVVGFLSLVTNHIPPVQVFGLFVAFGVASAWLLSLTLNPAFAMVLPDKALRNFGVKDDDAKSILSSILHGIRDFTRRSYRAILIGAALVVVVSAVGLSRIEVNDNPVKWFKSNHALRVADRELNRHLAGTYMSYLVIDGGEEDALKNPQLLAYIEKLQRYLEQNPIVGATAGVTDIVKKIRFELYGGEDRNRNALPETREEVGQFLFLYEMSGGDPDDLFKLVTSDYAQANVWVQLTAGDNQTVSKVVADADRFIADNPPPVPFNYHWAGLPYVNVVWQDKMVSGMRLSLLMSFGIVFLMMVFLFRSTLLGVISMLPLTITIMAIYAAIGFTGKSYDMPVAVLSSLTLGLSIDFAIHFIQRALSIHKRTGNFEETFQQIFEGPGRAISRNVLVIAIGFVPMFFSNLVPYITVGTFFFAIMTISGAVTLLLLPSLAIVFQKRIFPNVKEKVPVELPTQPPRKEHQAMKASLITLLLFSLLSLPGRQAAAVDLTAPEIMKKSHLAYYYAGDDGIANVTMTIDKKGKERTREFVMLRLDLADGGEQKYYTYFKQPSDVSRLTFMVWKNPDANDQRWLYVPSVDLVKQISADDKNSSFVGSDFTYEDVSGRHWTEDNHTLISANETLDGKPVYLISSRPIEAYKGFAEKKSWIDKETFLPLKEEYYNDKGELLRIFTAAKIEVIDGITTVTERVMENVEKGQKTTVKFDNITYNAGIKDDIFTERYLKNPPREFIK